MKNNFINFLVLLIVNLNVAYSSNFYCDPVNGNINNPGTFSQPWPALSVVMSSLPNNTFNANDTIFLLNGNHADVSINGVNSGGFVTIINYPNHAPVCQSIKFGNNSATAFWQLNGIIIRSENTQTYPEYLIEFSPITSNIKVINCVIQSSNNTVNWWRNDWRTRCKHGLHIEGNTHTVQNNLIENIAIGIVYEGNYCIIADNEIKNFAIDGIRIVKSNLNLIHNYIHDNINVYTYNENHYDGIQLYTCCPVGQDTISNVKIEQNTIINTTDTLRAYNGLMQGIGGFDGWFKNISIKNNIIIIDNWHGITLAGANNCHVLNNTLIDPYFTTKYDSLETQQSGNVGPCWIRITKHKNNTQSFNNIVRNNITPVLANDIGFGTEDYNITLPNTSMYSNHFVNYTQFDLHLISSSSAIDNGYYQYAPVVDADNVSRPQGNGFDIGAYEYLLTTRLTDNTAQDKLSCFPNPTDGQLTILTKNKRILSVEIQSALGETLRTFKDINDYKFNLTLSDFPKGIYFITIKTNTETHIKKVLLR
jgi:hypothetical protein